MLCAVPTGNSQNSSCRCVRALAIAPTNPCHHALPPTCSALRPPRRPLILSFPPHSPTHCVAHCWQAPVVCWLLTSQRACSEPVPLQLGVVSAAAIRHIIWPICAYHGSRWAQTGLHGPRYRPRLPVVPPAVLDHDGRGQPLIRPQNMPWPCTRDEQAQNLTLTLGR